MGPAFHFSGLRIHIYVQELLSTVVCIQGNRRNLPRFGNIFKNSNLHAVAVQEREMESIFVNCTPHFGGIWVWHFYQFYAKFKFLFPYLLCFEDSFLFSIITSF